MQNIIKTITFEKGLDNCPDARAIRVIVFVEEQKFINEFDDIDSYAHHMVMYHDKQPVATGRLFPTLGDNSAYIVGRVAVLQQYRNLHLGAEVMAYLEEKARSLCATHTQLSAQLQARGFYEKMGYQAFGDIYYEEHCPHIAMKKAL